MKPSIYLDGDGVLADFDKAAFELFGMKARNFEKAFGKKEFWKQIHKTGNFYRNLPLMPDALDLVAGVAHLSPTILTGCPRGDWAQPQKMAWAEEHCPGIPMITCRAADKKKYGKPGDVLIDDRPHYRHEWIKMGGIFISHYDAATSLRALFAHYPHLIP